MSYSQEPLNKLVVRRLHGNVRKSLQQCGFGRGTRLVVAVSGGPDSLALLHALNHLRIEMCFELVGAHLNHNLRGDASKSDARFVSQTFIDLGIRYILNEADVASFREDHRLSLEEAAREVRYDFLFAAAVEHDAEAVVTGHTADDQAETVLMRIIRGSGLTGLRGMELASKRTFNGKNVTLVRPLLTTSREEVLEYCHAMNLAPRLDESNLSTELTRNRMRLELMPLLKDFNPSIRDALVRLSSSAIRDISFIENEVESVWDRVAQFDEGCVTLDRSAVSKIHPSLQNHVLRRAVLLVKGDLEDVERNHIEDMARLIAGTVGKSLNLPGGLLFAVGYDSATLSLSRLDQSSSYCIEGECHLQIPGETRVQGWRIVAEVSEPDLEESTGKYTAKFDYDALGSDIWVRSRRAGDRIQPLGMAHTRKIQDVMVDAKIPRSLRDSVPLVVVPRGVAWVVGYRIADWARVQSDSSRQLVLRFVPEGSGDLHNPV